MQKILVPFDDNHCTLAALDYAAMFATGIGARIIALHLADPTAYQSIQSYQDDVRNIVRHRLRPKLAEIQQKYPDIQKIELQIRAKKKAVCSHILEVSSEMGIDFIVMRAQRSSADEHWESHFKSTTAYRVVLEATCPVFTFTEPPLSPMIENILVPLDLNDGSLFKVPLAEEFARRFGARLHLLSASEHLDDHEELEAQLNDLNTRLEEDNSDIIKNRVRSETLPMAIKSYTEKIPIDLVVIMSRPGFRWSDLWVSPKAKRIISESRVPVLSIRTQKPIEIGL